ncbi:MAG: polyisoprenoid-binding protein [Deltaproteobacteria bacterium]|nr:polyisoprenoid-binding protein [Deltaproteobacteria bacterium]
MKKSAVSVAAVVLVAPALAFAATYDLDPVHTTVSFSVRHMMVTNVRGEFQKVSGTIEYDAKNPQKSVIKVAIDPATISTRDEKRDAHLKSPDFFDVAKFPTMTFESTKVEAAAKGKLKVTGKLTMRGITKEIVLDVDGPSAELKDPWGNIKIGASATATVNRKDWGVSWNATLDAGGVVVGDEVKIQLDIEAAKHTDKKT